MSWGFPLGGAGDRLCAEIASLLAYSLLLPLNNRAPGRRGMSVEGQLRPDMLGADDLSMTGMPRNRTAPAGMDGQPARQ
jgi:hypothetical protein